MLSIRFNTCLSHCQDLCSVLLLRINIDSVFYTIYMSQTLLYILLLLLSLEPPRDKYTDNEAAGCDVRTVFRNFSI